MRMGRTELGAAVLASVILTVFGVVMGLTKAGTEAAAFGWFLALIGAVSLVANLVLRARMR
jgi:amino acid permease